MSKRNADLHNKKLRVLLLVLFAVGVIFRVSYIDRQGLWHDEFVLDYIKFQNKISVLLTF